MSGQQSLDNNGWTAYSKYVLKELERLANSLDAIGKKIDKNREEIVALRVKSSLWGSVGGFLAVVGALIIKWLSGK